MTPCGFPFQSPGHEYFCVLFLITRLQIQEACDVGDSGRGAYIPVSAPHTSIRLPLPPDKLSTRHLWGYSNTLHLTEQDDADPAHVGLRRLFFFSGQQTLLSGPCFFDT
jgi:hypothetical protein